MCESDDIYVVEVDVTSLSIAVVNLVVSVLLCSSTDPRPLTPDPRLFLASVSPSFIPHTSEKAFASVFCRFEQLLENNTLWHVRQYSCC